MKTNKEISPGETGKFVDKQTDKRIHEHLNNKNDVITEEDISNVRTDVGTTTEENSSIPVNKDQSSTGEAESDKEKADEMIKDNSDPDIDTVWNIFEK